MTAPDPAVSLEEIKRRSAAALEFPISGFAEDSIRACTLSAKDVPALVAAVERILELHRPEMFDGRDADGQEFGSYECITCDNGGLRDNWPCGTYLAITRELTGEAHTEAGSA